MKGGAVVERFAVLLLLGLGVGPVFGAFGKADEVGYRLGGLPLIKLAGDAAHGGIHHYKWAVGPDEHGGGCLGRVGQFFRGFGGLLGHGRGGKGHGHGGN